MPKLAQAATLLGSSERVWAPQGDCVEEEPLARSAADRGLAVYVDAVTKTFGSTVAVAGLHLDIEVGETVALLGPNGAGKSTTVAMLLGLLSPDCGGLRLGGLAPAAAVACGRVGAMMQDAGMMPGVRVGELLGMVRRLYETPAPLAEVVEVAGLGSVMEARVDRLSGGQAQRVRFALAVAGSPQLLILDEPTSAMDVEARQAFWRHIRSFATAGRTVLFTTHQLQEADAVADRIVVMAAGRKVADGSPTAIKKALGGRQLRCRVAGAMAPDLEGLAGVDTVEQTGSWFSLCCTDTDAAVRALVASGLRWSDLDVGGSGLEEAYLRLVRSVA
ncbi:MAG TPA: ABC transporter ATP-binding protein [Acidimicrobiales bacterium]|nr:ABC transporter ATP-binding protein [Acidimicrobiales bacterium]